MSIMVEVNDLKKTFKDNIVFENVSFSIHEGEIIGLIGPNGAGKSTLMKCLCGLQEADQGNIIINELDLKTHREEVLKIQSSLIENPALFLELTGRENLELIGTLRNIPKERIHEIEIWSGLNDSLKKKVSKYSLGMKQRLALSMAILNRPKFLMLDEPMNGLDPQGVIQLRKEIRDMSRNENITILISSHQLAEIEKIVDRCLYIENKTIKEVKKNTVHGYKLVTDTIIQDMTKLSFPIQVKNIERCEYIVPNEDIDIGIIISELRKFNIQVTEFIKNRDSLEDDYVEIFGIDYD